MSDESEVLVSNCESEHANTDSEQTAENKETIDLPEKSPSRQVIEENGLEQFVQLSRCLHKKLSEARESSGDTNVKSSDEQKFYSLNKKIENTRYLWRGKSSQDVEGFWDYQEKFSSWRKTQMSTSCYDGIEDWVRKLHIPKVHDDRMRIIYTSASADMRKSELRSEIKNSILATDPEICPLITQMKCFEERERLNLLKLTVETIEDILCLFNTPSFVECENLEPLIKQLSLTLNKDALNSLLHSQYTRKLVVISLCVLLDNNSKPYVLEVVKMLMFGAIRSGQNSQRASILTNLIERCNADELLWLAENISDLRTTSKQLQKSEIWEIVTRTLVTKMSDFKKRGSHPEWKKIIKKLEEMPRSGGNGNGNGNAKLGDEVPKKSL